MQNDNLKPNETEIQILNLGYGRFFDLFYEFADDKFWELSPEYRLLKIKNCFEIYTELTKYEPIKLYLAFLKQSRPPEEAMLAENYFSFIRNVLAHFPFFDSWDSIYITRELTGWDQPKNSSIQRFINKYQDRECVKFRVWNNEKHKMTYMNINFPTSSQDRIYLRDLVSEREGMLLCMVLMKKVLGSQLIQNPNNKGD